MKRKQEKIFIFIIVTCLVVITYLFALYVRDTKRLYTSSLEQFYDIVVKVKEDRMKEIIERTINDIDIERENVLEQCERLFINIEKVTQEVLTKNNMIDIYNKINSELVNVYPHLLIKAVIIDTNNSEIIYSNYKDTGENQRIYIDDYSNYINKFKYSAEYDFTEEGKLLLIGIKKDDIEKSVKINAIEKIRKTASLDNGYIWINEILDFDGGDNYARRLLHPNLDDTEGLMLYTDFKDIKGNSPYKDELDGINKNGEALIKYYFKKSESDEIAQKLSYIKLYPKYNWAIGTGVYLDDLELYMNRNISQFKKQLISQITITVVTGIMGTLIFNYYEMRKRMLIQKENEIFKNHYSLMESKYDKASEIIHDIKNHLICIEGLAAQDNSGSIVDYVGSINYDISQLGYVIITGNKIIDIILNEKIYVMKSNNIEFKHCIELIDLEFIDYKDLVTILSNLLDNSIESCILSEKKEIKLNMYIFNGSFIVVKALNSSDNKPKNRRDKLLTNKENKMHHGYGIKNIIKVVEKYDGNFKWSYDNKEKVFNVIIMIPRERTDI